MENLANLNETSRGLRLVLFSLLALFVGEGWALGSAVVFVRLPDLGDALWLIHIVTTGVYVVSLVFMCLGARAIRGAAEDDAVRSRFGWVVSLFGAALLVRIVRFVAGVASIHLPLWVSSMLLVDIGLFVFAIALVSLAEDLTMIQGVLHYRAIARGLWLYMLALIAELSAIVHSGGEVVMVVTSHISTAVRVFVVVWLAVYVVLLRRAARRAALAADGQ